MYTRALVLILLYIGSVNSAGECDAGVVKEECTITSGDDEQAVFFCSDRYVWEWSENASPMSIVRSDSVAISVGADVLDQTSIVVMGGCSQEEQLILGFCDTITPSVEIYTPATDTWKTSTPMPNERFRFGSVLVGSNIFVFGGRDVMDSLVCDTDVFNVVTEEWTTLTDYPWEECTSDIGIFESGGKIFLTGGYTDFYETLNTTTIVDIEYVGDVPVTLTYTPGASLNYPRGDHSCWSDGEDVAYCIGGFDDSQQPLASVEKYSVETDIWAVATGMSIPRGDFVLGNVNGQLTVVGGETYGENFNVGVTSIEWYDMENDCWSSSVDIFELPYSRFRFGGAVDSEQSRLYIFGGQGEAVGDAYPLVDSVFWYQEFGADYSAAGGYLVSFFGFILSLSTMLMLS